MNTASSSGARPPQDYVAYASDAYPQAFGALLDCLLANAVDRKRLGTELQR